MPRIVRKERPHRDLLQIPDFSAKEIDSLFALAEKMRAGRYRKKPLAGKSLAMIFMKSSTRTRVSFEVGAWQLGGHALFLSPRLFAWPAYGLLVGIVYGSPLMSSRSSEPSSAF